MKDSKDWLRYARKRYTFFENVSGMDRPTFKAACRQVLAARDLPGSSDDWLLAAEIAASKPCDECRERLTLDRREVLDPWGTGEETLMGWICSDKCENAWNANARAVIRSTARHERAKPRPWRERDWRNNPGADEEIQALLRKREAFGLDARETMRLAQLSGQHAPGEQHDAHVRLRREGYCFTDIAGENVLTQGLLWRARSRAAREMQGILIVPSYEEAAAFARDHLAGGSHIVPEPVGMLDSPPLPTRLPRRRGRRGSR